MMLVKVMKEAVEYCSLVVYDSVIHVDRSYKGTNKSIKKNIFKVSHFWPMLQPIGDNMFRQFPGVQARAVISAK